MLYRGRDAALDISLGVGVRRKSYQLCRILRGNHTGFQGEDLAGLEACSVARVLGFCQQ